MAEQIRSNGLNGFSIFWGGLVRIDFVKVLPEARFTFYGPKALQLHMVPTKEADEFYKKEVGTLLTPQFGRRKAESWTGLETRRELRLEYEDSKKPTCDVAISGLRRTIYPIIWITRVQFRRFWWRNWHSCACS